MMAFRHSVTGEVQHVASAAGIGPEWRPLPAPPAIDGWAWDQQAGQWVQRGPRIWRPVEFVRVLFTPAELVAAATLPSDTAERALFRWAYEVASRAPTVNLDDDNTQAFIALAVQNGVLTQARAARVLSGLPPE